jgi:plasmid stabilization system protein ParE
MKHALRIRPEAEVDMAEGRDWYNSRREGLGIEFLTAVEAMFDWICENPELYAAEYKLVRRAGVHHFPYIVYYRLVEETVEVMAVLHGSRNPRIWRSRT